MNNYLRLGVNIDHVATLRNARGASYPDPIKAAILASSAGADGITLHLREDRRHIQDQDVFRLKEEINLPINFEMAATKEMLAIALKLKPNAVCIVPEKRTEVTTEGGLDLKSDPHSLTNSLKNITYKLKEAGILVSLFIDADQETVLIAKELGANIIEIHTGKYAEQARELDKITKIAKFASGIGLEVHAGHGLTIDNVGLIAAITEIKELNIGHSLISDAIFIGLGEAIKNMRQAMTAARAT